MIPQLLIFFFVLLIMLSVGNISAKENIVVIENNSVDFNSLTTQQKLAQMIIIRGDKFNKDFTSLNMGGIFLDKQTSLENYTKLIEAYQNSSKIKLFVSTDFEGAWSPFSKSNISEEIFPKFSDISTSEEAYDVGFRQGILLKELGFNINFAPVAEFKDKAYGGRVFTGTKEEIKEKLSNYIKGLQKNVKGICKHYPGKGMIRNTHLRPEKQKITKEDLELFETCFNENITGVMIGHQKAHGILDSKNKPSTVSKEIIESIDSDFIIASDEINMLGLKLFYLFNKRKLYRDLINSGNNLILDFKLNPKKMQNLLGKLEKDVKKGLIDEKKINESVKKILKSKGYVFKIS